MGSPCAIKMKQKEMNKWQKYYCDKYHKGKEPRDEIGKIEFATLGLIKDYVIVDFPEIKKPTGVVPAFTQEFKVTFDELDMPNGLISVDSLASNVILWISRKYRIKTR